MNKLRFVRVGMGLGLALATACSGPAVTTTGPTRPMPSAGAGAQAASPSGLAGSWRLVSLTEDGKPPVGVSEPDRFTATFGEGGRLTLRTDCNRCAGAYTEKPGALSVGLMACTLAQCPSAPLDTTFGMLVQQATTWKSADGALELRGDAGVLHLQR
jgi:heat shock protein HslJ